MTYMPRFIDKFTDSDDDVIYRFPLSDYEWEGSQSLRTPSDLVTGANYGYDYMGAGPSLKAFSQERLRFLIYERCGPLAIDEHIQRMRTRLFDSGLGKLYTRSKDGDRRWAWARLANMPELTVQLQPAAIKTMPVSVEFRRQSDWYGVSPITPLSTVISTSPKTVVVVNNGDQKVYNVVFLLKGTYTNPKIENLTATIPDISSVYTFQSTRDGSSANHWLKMDAGSNQILWSTNAGVLYVSDYGNYVRLSYQVQLMVLEPGNNSIRLTGCNGATFLVTGYPAYH